MNEMKTGRHKSKEQKKKKLYPILKHLTRQEIQLLIFLMIIPLASDARHNAIYEILTLIKTY